MSACTVYILLTRSGTWFSRLIHLATRASYTHASIGLDGPAGPFYSFGRLSPRHTLPAGLVQERLESTWQTASRPVPCCLYELEVEQETFRDLRETLRGMYERRGDYRYSVLGVLSCSLELPLARHYHFFCSQFVAALLQDCGAVPIPKTPALMRPMDLCALSGLRPVHRGSLDALREMRPALAV